MSETYSEPSDHWKLFFEITFSKTSAWKWIKIRFLAYCDFIKAITTFLSLETKSLDAYGQSNVFFSFSKFSVFRGREASRLQEIFGAKGAERPVSRKIFGAVGATGREASRLKVIFGAEGAKRPVSRKFSALRAPRDAKRPVWKGFLAPKASNVPFREKCLATMVPTVPFREIFLAPKTLSVPFRESVLVP